MNKKVIIGIRPTDFSTEYGSEIKVHIDVIEPLGNEFYVHGRCVELMLSARIPEGVHPDVGTLFSLKADTEKIYIFDAETEEALQ